ncbi:uncharacterized protein [Amphiura filiformis]|uniref:uncharacterized protein n=1 Tax=Amphiura filiformis TaxID=82378 RepID=UPI003B2280E8
MVWLCIYLLLWFRGEVAGTSPDCRLGVYRQYNAQKLINHVIHDFTARSLTDCVAQCGRSMNDKCMSFNWRQVDKTCELSDADKDGFPTTTSSSWQYYEIDKNFEGQCQFVTCENGALCEPTCANKDNFICRCNPGHTGRRCHISEECLEPLGMASGYIANSQIITSSETATSSSVRLTDGTGWSASSADASPWIQIKFLVLIAITGVITKGGPGTTMGWVTEYKLSYEDVTDSYKDAIYTHSAGDKTTFDGNSDTETEVTHLLDPLIKTTALTFMIVSWEGTCTLRVEVLGCKHEATSSESEVGWTVKHRLRGGRDDNVQRWVTPIQFPCHGVVTQWRYWASRSAPFKAMIFRNVTADWTVFDIIGINNIPAGEIEQVVTHHVPDNERIVVEKGDVIGVAWNSPVPRMVDEGDDESEDAMTVMTDSSAVPDDLEVNDRLVINKTRVRAYSIHAVVSDWVLAFKGAAGNNRGILADWTHTGNFDNADNARLISNTADNFRDNFIYNFWGTITFQKAKVTLLDSLGFVLNEIEFDAVDSTTSSWFAQSRVLATSWTDLVEALPNHFSLQGDGDLKRRFFINFNYGGCDVANGWLCVKDEPHACTWEQPQPGESYPIILYSRATTSINWTSGDKGRAAALLIYVI